MTRIAKFIEKETSRKHAHKIRENKEMTCLETLIFMSSLVRNRSFNFSRFAHIISKWHAEAPEIEACKCFVTQNWLERNLKSIQKKSPDKLQNILKLYLIKTDIQKRVRFGFFGVRGHRRPRVVPRTPPSTDPMSICVENCTKMVS